jgi:hypothetical protein
MRKTNSFFTQEAEKKLFDNILRYLTVSEGAMALWCYGETGYKFSSSGGRSVFFAVLHSLQQGTRFPLVERPPLDRGII